MHVLAMAGSRVPGCHGLVILAGTGMGSRAMATGERCLRREFWTDPAVVHAPDIDRLVSEEELACIVALPILQGSLPVGVLWASTRDRAKTFSGGELTLLRHITAQAAIAIENARALATARAARAEADRRRREVQSLLDVAGQLISVTEPAEVLHGVLAIIARLFSLKRVGIATNEGTHALSRGLWDDGVWRPSGTRIPLHGSVSGWVIRNRTSYAAAT